MTPLEMVQSCQHYPDLVGGAPQLLKSTILGALHHTAGVIRVRVTAAGQEPAGTQLSVVL